MSYDTVRPLGKEHCQLVCNLFYTTQMTYFYQLQHLLQEEQDIFYCLFWCFLG